MQALFAILVKYFMLACRVSSAIATCTRKVVFGYMSEERVPKKPFSGTYRRNVYGGSRGRRSPLTPQPAHSRRRELARPCRAARLAPLRLLLALAAPEYRRGYLARLGFALARLHL